MDLEHTPIAHDETVDHASDSHPPIEELEKRLALEALFTLLTYL